MNQTMRDIYGRNLLGYALEINTHRGVMDGGKVEAEAEQ